jgi:hypothetical protein
VAGAKATIELASVRRDIKLHPKESSRRLTRDALWFGVGAVLDAAIMPDGTSDLRRGVLTAVYNYDTESFEIRWDLAK